MRLRAASLAWIPVLIVPVSCGSGGGGGGFVDGGMGGSGASSNRPDWTCTLWTEIDETRMFCDCAFKYVPAEQEHTMVSHCDVTSFSVPSVCCSYATPDYPECLCAPILCEPAGTGCQCSSFVNNGPGVTTTCTGQTCCLATVGAGANEFCRCGTEPCTADETQVASCSASVMACAPPNQSVSNCAIAPAD